MRGRFNYPCSHQGGHPKPHQSSETSVEQTMDHPSVERLCNLLARTKLLPSAQVRALHQRWRAEAGKAADDPVQFARWLAAAQAVTEFQLGLLTRGFADLLFLDEYRLID